MRYATIPAERLRPVLGLTREHVEGDWLTPAESWGKHPPTDADGNPIENCVFCDTETGLVVIEDPKPAEGRFPLRCENRKAPLTVAKAKATKKAQGESA
jgi:hypothetical protein